MLGGDGVEAIELGKRIGVLPCSSLTNDLGVGISHVSISDFHFVGLVALDPLRYREVVFVICKFYAFDQPI